MHHGTPPVSTPVQYCTTRHELELQAALVTQVNRDGTVDLVCFGGDGATHFVQRVSESESGLPEEGKWNAPTHGGCAAPDAPIIEPASSVDLGIPDVGVAQSEFRAGLIIQAHHDPDPAPTPATPWPGANPNKANSEPPPPAAEKKD